MTDAITDQQPSIVKRTVYRESTTFRVSIAACILAFIGPVAACQAVKAWQEPKREQACVEGGGNWAYTVDDKGKPTGRWSCFQPDEK